LGTVYQNDTPRIKEIVVSAFCKVNVYGGKIDGRSGIIGYTGAVSPPTRAISISGVYGFSPGSGFEYVAGDVSLTFFVLPHDYYMVSTSKDHGGADATLNSWVELTLRN
jgi:hypothetical protein